MPQKRRLNNWTEVSSANELLQSRESRRRRVTYVPDRLQPSDYLQEQIDREYANARARQVLIARLNPNLPVINRNSYRSPPILNTNINAIRRVGRIGSSINIINADIDARINQQSSAILEKIIGVTDRSDIESQGATSQMKHIRDRLITFGGRRNPPWVYNPNGVENHNKSIRTIDDIDNNRNINRIKCYGTGKNIHFYRNPNGPEPDLQNEWEHMVPNLYQLLINGLAYESNKSMPKLLKLAMGRTFTDPEYESFSDICYLAQNRCLLLSAKAFNQAKCSYMLFQVNYVNYRGNHIIQLSVNDAAVDIVYDRMENGRRSIHKACYSNDPEVPTPLQRKPQFIRNLRIVCDEYNSVMKEKDGLFGAITFACGCISAAVLSYNCPTGRQIYNNARATDQNYPLVYYMAMRQMVILNGLKPTILANQTILNGETILNGGRFSDVDSLKYYNFNKIPKSPIDLTTIEEHLSPSQNPWLTDSRGSNYSSKIPTGSNKDPKIRKRSNYHPKIRTRSNYSKNPTRSKTLKTLSKHIDFSIIPETTSLVNENDISDSQEFLKGCIDLLNRLFTDERITWGNDLYSYRFNKVKMEGGSKRRKRRTKRRTKRR